MPITVNDLGCGYGALFAYLDRLDGVNLEHYFGYDINGAALEAAREHADERATFVQADEITTEADYSLLSGTLNYKGNASNEAWSEHVKQMIRHVAARSRLGFAFNLMTTYVDYTKPDLFYADPAHFFTFCNSHISRYVTLLHDYPLYEWTMLVRKHVPDESASVDMTSGARRRRA